MIFINVLIYVFVSLLKIYSSGIEEPVYYVSKTFQPIEINAIWDKEPWNEIQPLLIDEKVGKKFEFQPEVQAKIAYDQEAIYVIFKVEDRYVKCITEEYQGSVYKDSCVEFFFTPGPDITSGYFNLEMNCIGTALFKYHDTLNNSLIEISLSEFKKITVAHSIPSPVKKEIEKPITWTVEYRIPFSVLGKYVDLSYPAQGVMWKANFYKIANESSHPHWLTWSKVDLPEPDFHRPEFFGVLEF